MFLFGGWDYGAILSIVDSLVYGRRYGGFFDIITNFTVRELLELFRVIHNKENEKNLKEAIASGNSAGSKDIPTQGLSQEMLDILMDT